MSSHDNLPRIKVSDARLSGRDAAAFALRRSTNFIPAERQINLQFYHSAIL
jgi:hypothetical protein